MDSMIKDTASAASDEAPAKSEKGLGGSLKRFKNSLLATSDGTSRKCRGD